MYTMYSIRVSVYTVYSVSITVGKYMYIHTVYSVSVALCLVSQKRCVKRSKLIDTPYVITMCTCT